MRIRMKRLVLIVALLAGVLVLAACGSDEDDNSGEDSTPTIEATAAPAADEAASAEYQTLSIDAFADIIENEAGDYQIINVHIPYAGDIPNTDANIPYNDLDALTAAIPSPDTPVILYCRSGNMSEQASRALVERGYTQVWDVPGGMVAWQDSGRELIDQ